MEKKLVLLTILLIAVSISGCPNTPSNENRAIELVKTYPVFVTFYPISLNMTVEEILESVIEEYEQEKYEKIEFLWTAKHFEGTKYKVFVGTGETGSALDEYNNLIFGIDIETKIISGINDPAKTLLDKETYGSLFTIRNYKEIFKWADIAQDRDAQVKYCKNLDDPENEERCFSDITCYNDSDCIHDKNNRYCDTDENHCIPCRQDADCTYDEHYRYCDTEEINRCVECKQNSHCPTQRPSCGRLGFCHYS